MSPKPLQILSGGAAQVLVESERAAFESAHGVELHCAFGAVGAMRDKLLAGADCDVLILSQALVDALQTSGHVVAGSARAVGQVHAGVALKSGAAGADIALSLIHI